VQRAPAPEEQREAACVTTPAKRTRKPKRGVTCVRVRVSFAPCPAAGNACSADAR
jgi:hypothetical protein